MFHGGDSVVITDRPFVGIGGDPSDSGRRAFNLARDSHQCRVDRDRHWATRQGRAEEKLNPSAPICVTIAG
jgi:hypothetical protein